MSDIYNEYLVQCFPDRKTTLLKVAIYAGCVLLCAGLLFLAFSFPVYLLFCVVPIVGVIYGAIFLVRQLNIEYEYILTNDNLDVDKIIARSRRREMLSVDVKTFEILAPVCDEYSAELEREYTSVLDFSSGEISEDKWFAVYPGENGSTLLIFEPTERMVAGIRTFNPRAVKSKGNG